MCSTAGSRARRSRRRSGSTAVVGNFASPYAPGTAYVLLHHVFGEVNGKPGLGTCHRRHGRDHAGDGRRVRARGVALARGAESRTSRERAARRACSSKDGRVIEARRVVANVNPKLLYRAIVAPEHCRTTFRSASKPTGAARHVPHECRVVRAAGLRVPARPRRRSPITRAASSWRLRSRTWSRRTSTRARRAGRARRSSRC